MPLDAWLTLAVVALCLGLLAATRLAADIVLVGGLTLLLVAGVLTPGQALAGLANEGMVTVGVLFVVVAGLRDTGAISWIVHYVLGRPRSLPHAQVRLMAPVVGLSAFLNNTPVVAMMIPAVQDWARRNALSVSKLLIPLSYAAIAGGTCTLIGTSTNLVVNGLLIAETHRPGLTMFELAWIGVPVAASVVAAVVLFGNRALPERRSAISQFEDARGYTVEMLVVANGPLVGKTIEEAGLRQLPGLYLIEIDRDDQVLAAVSPQEHLHANDRLVFAGVIESVVDLQRIRGLKLATDQIFKLDVPRSTRCLLEAVVSEGCPLVGKSVRAGRFRSRYNAVVIAVSRHGEQLKMKIGDIVLQPGDTLLLEGHPSFLEQHRNSRDFYLISQLEGATRPRHDRAPLAFAILAAMVGSAAAGWLSMLEAALLAAGAMVATRCTAPRAARDAIDWQLLIVIAASLGIGQALSTSGAAQAIAQGLASLGGRDPWVGLALVYCATALFTAVITNNTAAVLMFPIALSMAHALHADAMPFVVTVMIAASMSFATPIGYQTNLMVYGPGGYHFVDYLRLGIPLTVVVGILVLLIVPQVWAF